MGHRIMFRSMDPSTLPSLLGIGAAFLAGMASFLSPCVAPLLPGYVAFVAGGGGAEHRAGATARAGGFVAGFVVLFALLGAGAAAVSGVLLANRATLELVSGLVVALLGLAMLFDRAVVPGAIGARLQMRSSQLGAPATAVAAMPVGAAFAVAWTPCIGPALAAILALAAGQARPLWGATLLVAYGLGLGVPFVAGAIALDRVQGLSTRMRRHAQSLRRGGGILLLVLGISIATGGFGRLTAHMARLVPDWLV